MLSKILSKEECASCRFCCSFRRQSLWEVPVFTSENISVINASNNDTSNSLIPFESDGKVYAKYDLSDKYLTSDSEEEVKCPFLDINKGCILSSDEKPWDCKIWPFRVVKKESGEPFVVLTPTCPGVGKLSSSAKPANKLQVFFTRFLIIFLLHSICSILPRQKRPSNSLTLNKALFTNSFRCCYASISFKTLDTLE